MRKLLSFCAFVLLGVGLVAVPAAPALAAPTWYYTAWTGATYANVLNSTVSSDITATSGIQGDGNATSNNSTAAVDVSKLLSVGAAQTRTTATDVNGTLTLDSWARTAGINLLDGLIKVDALETTSRTIGNVDGTLGSISTNSKLVGLKIVGVEVPLEIPKNWAVTIPGVATVNANFSLQSSERGEHRTLAWGLGVQLLRARDGYEAGATIVINPLAHNLQKSDPEAEVRVGGFSYSSRVQANVGDGVKVVSDPTALLMVPVNSSEGQTLTQSTASANVPGVLTLGALKSTNTSNRDETGAADATATNETAGLNLLGGLITADAIGVSASSHYHVNPLTQQFEYTSELKMTTVNLVVAGQKIPVDVSPNTSLDIAGLGKVELNVQAASQQARANAIIGVRVTLDTARAGLPIGAVIELSVAHTIIRPVSGS